MLKAEKVVFNYSLKEKEVKALKGVSLQLEKGQIIAVTGPSGGGKTTLLKALYGLIDIQEGTIEADGEKVWGPSMHLIPGEDRMSLVQQDFGLLKKHHVYDNLEPLLRHLSETEKHREIMKMLRLVRLEKFRNHLPEQLSGGQQQRLAIARALCNAPDYLLLDEPFSQLDQELQQNFMKYIQQKVKSKEWGVLYTTHDPVEALSKADQIYFVHQGNIQQKASPHTIFFQPKNNIVAAYFGFYNLNSARFFQLFEADQKNFHSIKDQVFTRPSQWVPAEKGGQLFILKGTEFRGNHQYLQLHKDGEIIHASVPAQKSYSITSPYRFKPVSLF